MRVKVFFVKFIVAGAGPSVNLAWAARLLGGEKFGRRRTQSPLRRTSRLTEHWETDWLSRAGGARGERLFLGDRTMDSYCVLLLQQPP